jgi:hypothetical protein
MGHPCKENSKYKMWIGFHGEKPNVTRYSFPVNDHKGADYQFWYMYHKLLSRRFSHQYNRAEFYDVATDTLLKVVEKGGIIINQNK